MIFNDGKHGLEGLFHGAHGNFQQAVGLDEAALGVLAVDETDLVNAEFGRFLDEPFNAVGIYRGRDGDVNEIVFLRRRVFGAQFKVALGRVGGGDGSLIEEPLPIGDGDGISRLPAQDTDAVTGFFRVEKQNSFGDVGLVEEVQDLKFKI